MAAVSRQNPAGAGGRPTAILLGGGPIALSVARSLAGAGVPVRALGAERDPVARSRSCLEFVDLGSGDGVQDRWLDWLSRRRDVGAVVLSCNDEALELTSRHRETLVRLGYRLGEANPEATLAMLDKQDTYALARRIGVPAPRTIVARPGDGAEVARGLEYPCAIKPRHSHLFQRHLGLRTKAYQAADPGELSSHLERTGALGLEMIVTEIIPGAEDSFHSYYGYLDERGETLLRVTKRKLRQYPPHFGLTTYHVMTWEPEVAELGLKFLQGVGLRGIGVVEFKRDPRDGTLKLIECNARFTLGTELIRHAGVDLAVIAYDRALGVPVGPNHSYRVGARMWYPIEDARAALVLRREGELSMRRWLRSVSHRQHFPLWAWRDPLPSLHSLSRLPAQVVRRSTRAGRGDASTAPSPAIVS